MKTTPLTAYDKPTPTDRPRFFTVPTHYPSSYAMYVDEYVGLNKTHEGMMSESEFLLHMRENKKAPLSPEIKTSCA